MYYRYINDAGRESLLIHGEDICATVPGSHPRFTELVGYFRSHAEHNSQHVRDLLDTGGTIAAEVRQLSERASYDGTSLRFDGDVINTNLSRHIVRMLRDRDHSYQRWIRFLEHLAANPSRQSRMHLYMIPRGFLGPTWRSRFGPTTPGATSSGSTPLGPELLAPSLARRLSSAPMAGPRGAGSSSQTPQAGPKEVRPVGPTQVREITVHLA